jgi:hypothetical protein
MEMTLLQTDYVWIKPESQWFGKIYCKIGGLLYINGCVHH